LVETSPISEYRDTHMGESGGKKKGISTIKERGGGRGKGGGKKTLWMDFEGED